MRSLVTKALFVAILSPASWAQVGLDNPVSLATESGIGVISGFHCTSRDISFRINGISIGKAGAGTERGDTKALCGRTDTGFSLLFNFNLLTPGTHSLGMYADGQLVETRSFKSIKSAGEEFAQNKYKRILVPDFPITGHSAILEWVTAKQDFVVTDSGLYAAANFSCDMTESLHGVWTVENYRFNLHRDNMTRDADPKDAIPCMIVSKESNSFRTYSASFSPARQEFMFLQYDTISGTAYLMKRNPSNSDELVGFQQGFWVSDFSFINNQKPAKATRLRFLTPTAVDTNSPSPSMESIIHTNQAIGARLR
ncbi:hypothetical protein [Limnohabitans sp.]|uniref:hypothetical protein n=1 Tax=Limnohabitans sp. TaxID=1907725 RepID=UPI0031FBE5FF